MALKAPARTTLASTASPWGVTIFALYLTTLPVSVISRCSSNQKRSRSGIDGSDFACASFVTNSSRSGYCALMSELCTTEEKSFATWRTTPNISPKFPARDSSCVCISASFFSLASNEADNCALRRCCSVSSARASAVSVACLLRSARNFCSRSSLDFASRCRTERVCSSSSSRLAGAANVHGATTVRIAAASASLAAGIHLLIVRSPSVQRAPQ